MSNRKARYLLTRVSRMTSWVLLNVGGGDGGVQELVIDWLVPKVALAVAGSEVLCRTFTCPLPIEDCSSTSFHQGGPRETNDANVIEPTT